MIFKKGRGRINKSEWKWGKEEIEAVKEMSYLDYIM